MATDELGAPAAGLGKIGVQPHIAELAINHVRGGVEAVYDRHRYQGEIRAFPQGG